MTYSMDQLPARRLAYFSVACPMSLRARRIAHTVFALAPVAISLKNALKSLSASCAAPQRCVRRIIQRAPVTRSLKKTRAQTAALIAIWTLSGCSALRTWVEPDRVNYRDAPRAPALLIPSDLKPVIPDSDARLSPPPPMHAGANRNGSTPALSDVSVECARNPCALIVRGRAPEQLWLHLREFWLQLGFTLAQDRPGIGLIETNWAENRAKIPNDWLRQKLGVLGDRLYSSGTRDQFRMLVERGQNDATIISITHRGMEEVLTGRAQESTRSQARAREPALERLLLGRLLESFGLTPEQARQRMAQAGPAAAHAH